MKKTQLIDMIYEELFKELHKKGHADPKGRELMKGEEDLEEASYVRDADTPGYFSPWSSEYKKDKKRKDEYNAMNKMSDYEDKEGPVEEGKPMFQDTPNELAYLDFKKWAYKKRGSIKKALKKALGNREDGTKMFIALRDIWITWANAHAKEWSYTHSTGVAKKDFGRALAIMMKKDGLIISKSGNKLTGVEEGLWANINAKKKRGEKSARKGSKAYKAAKKAGDKLEKAKEGIREAVYDKLLKAVPDSYSYKALAADIAKMIKDEYGSHNIKPFIKELSKLLKEGNINEATSLWKHFDMLQNMRMDSMDLEDDMRGIAKELSQTHKDMEQEAEPEGGPKATRYGKQIEKLEKEYKKKKAEFKKLMAKIDKLDQF